MDSHLLGRELRRARGSEQRLQGREAGRPGHARGERVPLRRSRGRPGLDDVPHGPQLLVRGAGALEARRPSRREDHAGRPGGLPVLREPTWRRRVSIRSGHRHRGSALVLIRGRRDYLSLPERWEKTVDDTALIRHVTLRELKSWRGCCPGRGSGGGCTRRAGPGQQSPKRPRRPRRRRLRTRRMPAEVLLCCPRHSDAAGGQDAGREARSRRLDAGAREADRGRADWECDAVELGRCHRLRHRARPWREGVLHGAQEVLLLILSCLPIPLHRHADGR